MAAQLLAARSPAFVERVFSRGAYPSVGGGLACLTAPAPFSIGEALLFAGAAFAVWRTGQAIRRRQLSLGAALRRATIAVGAAYLAFLMLWGLNYQRQPFAVTAGLDARYATLAELVAVTARLTNDANQLRQALLEDEHGVMRLPDGGRAALLRTAAGFERAAGIHPILAGSCARPKPLVASLLLSFLGIAGIYCPFTGEANVNMTVPDPDLPFDASHEVAHLRGFAREDEANYLGYLACRLHPDRDFRYSGVLTASLYAAQALGSVDPAARDRLIGTRSPAVARDVVAIAAWALRYRGPALELSRQVNNAYLRSQGQRDGIRSYGRMVDLLIAEARVRD